MDKVCKTCQNKFTTSQKRQLFCSISCGQKSRHSKNKVFCKNCNVEFETCFGSNARIFCSSECFHKWNTGSKIKLICETCSKEFFKVPSAAKFRRTCSKACKYKLMAVENSIKFKGIEGKDHNSYRNGNTYYKKDALKNLPNICICCNRQDIRFDVHHIDGDRKNNILQNLCIMCCSCHKRLHKISIKYSISLEKSLEVAKLIGHLPKVKNYLRLPGSVEEIEIAVSAVLASSV